MTSHNATLSHEGTERTSERTSNHTSERGNGGRFDVAILVLRLGLGIVMLAHGLQKFGQGMDGVSSFFGSVGIPLPAVAAPVVAGIETVGGIALIVGVLTRIVAALLAVSSTVALFTVHIGAGFFVADGGYELVLLLAIALVAVIIAGPGRFTVVNGVRGIPAILR